MGLLTSLIKTGLTAAAAIVGGPVGIALAAASQMTPDGQPGMTNQIPGAIMSGLAQNTANNQPATPTENFQDMGAGDTIQAPGVDVKGTAGFPSSNQSVGGFNTSDVGAALDPRAVANNGAIPDFTKADELTKLTLLSMDRRLRNTRRG